MRLKMLFAVALALSLSGFACAQEPVCTPGVFVQGSGIGPGQQGFPYIIKAKSSLDQRLPDGSSIRGYTHILLARDSKGRVLSELPQGCSRDKDGKPQARLSVNVLDIEGKTGEWWQVGQLLGRDPEKIAHIHHLQQLVAAPPAPRILVRSQLAAQHKTGEAQQTSRSEYKTEDLGTRSIAGEMAQGTRETHTIPAGEEGNETPLAIVIERWRSKDLGMLLMETNDDPRRGRTTYEVEEISRTEPDAALFSPPADYKVVEDAPPRAETIVKP